MVFLIGILCARLDYLSNWLSGEAGIIKIRLCITWAVFLLPGACPQFCIPFIYFRNSIFYNFVGYPAIRIGIKGQISDYIEVGSSYFIRIVLCLPDTPPALGMAIDRVFL